MHHVPLVIPLRLRMVREDHFRKISSERPCGGPSVVIGSLQHVWRHCGGRWLTSVFEIHLSRVSYISHARRPTHLGLLDHIVCLGHAGHLCMH